MFGPSKSLSWNYRIQGKVSRITQTSPSLSYLTRLSDPLKLMVRQPHRRTQKHSHEPPDIGVPTYRTYVQYIPQRPSLLPGTPRDLIETLSTFHARFAPERASEGHDHFESSMVLAEQWGIAKELWDRPWSLVSVGESQRLSLAIAYGFNRAEVLMLDGACFTITMPSPLIYIRFTRNS